MAYYKSSDEVKKNATKWTANLPRSGSKSRRSLPRIENLANYVRLPSERDVIGRYHTLFEKEKFKNNRIRQVYNELNQLWQNMSFPILSRPTITSKLNKLINNYESHQKYCNEDLEINMENVFDITKTDGEWLCEEDKKLYQKQISSGGKVGYTTHKPAPVSSIHPSKRLKFNEKKTGEQSTNVDIPDELFSESETSSDSDTTLLLGSDDDDTGNKASKKASTKHATKLVTKLSLSTNKASNVCFSLSESGVSLPTPTQSGVWRSVVRAGKKQKDKIISILQEENCYCLHFDGKRMSNDEYQVIVLQSETRQIKLGIRKCDSGSAQDIYKGIENVLDEFDAWSSIKMIICDTTAVNTGHINGVVVKIQQKMREKGIEQPQYIGCQHHILDRILKHVLDFFVGKPTTKPSLNYDYIDIIIQRYAVLQVSYKSDMRMSFDKNPGWRDDFKFLYELCMAFQFYEKNGKLPEIKWRTLPSLHSARWNSRAIYTLIAYFLLPEWRDALQIPSTFIANGWQEAWFSDQKFKEHLYGNLHSNIKELKCPSALKCFVTHWNNDRSMVDIPRTNIIAERAIKLMEELHQVSKKDEYMNLKFIASNNF